MKIRKFALMTLALMLVLSLCLTGFSVNVAAADPQGQLDPGVTWRLDTQKRTLFIEGSGDMPDIDVMFQGYPAYHNYADRIQKIDVADGITRIGTDSFSMMKNVTSITLGKGLFSVGDGAFVGCDKLKTVNLRDTDALENWCSIIIGDDINDTVDKNTNPMARVDTLTIGGQRITELDIPQGVTAISDGAFVNCDNIISVNLPDSLVDLGYSAFYECSKLKTVTFGNSLRSIADYAFCRNHDLVSIDIPDTVETMGEGVFEECENLNSVKLPADLTHIAPLMFKNCTALTEITLPASVTGIDNEAFNFCKNLKKITLSSILENIGESAFANTSALHEIKLPNTLRNIGQQAFYRSALHNVTVPASVEKYTYAFCHMTGLESVVIEPGCGTISELAFAGSAPAYIVIPSSVTSIEKKAFDTDMIGLGDDCQVDHILYQGSEAQWNRIKHAAILEGAVIHFNASGKEVSWQNTSYGRAIICSECQKVIYAENQVERIELTRMPNVTQYVKGYEGDLDLTGGKLTVYLTTGRSSVISLSEAKIGYLYTGSTGKKEVSVTYYEKETVLPLEVVDKLPDPKPEPQGFVDVAPGSYCEDSVKWAVENGITKGTDDTHFSPDEKCIRRHVMMFLWRSQGQPEPASMHNPFSDVPHGVFEKPILWGVGEGITSGYKDGTFRPNDLCSRKHIVMFLWRSVGKPEPKSTNNPFSDVKHNQFEKAILWAAENGITTGYKDGTFRPDDICTRGQIVTFLYRNQLS